MPVTKVKSAWDSGSLVFKDSASGIAVLTLDPARQYEYDEIITQGFLASAEAVTGCFMPAPHSGVVTRVYATNYNACSGTEGPVITILVSAVSAGTISFGSSDASGTVNSLTLTTLNAIDQGGVIGAISDGGHTNSLPIGVMAVVRR